MHGHGNKAWKCWKLPKNIMFELKETYYSFICLTFVLYYFNKLNLKIVQFFILKNGVCGLFSIQENTVLLAVILLLFVCHKKCLNNDICSNMQACKSHIYIKLSTTKQSKCEMITNRLSFLTIYMFRFNFLPLLCFLWKMLIT
jgi:hypothetical protein